VAMHRSLPPGIQVQSETSPSILIADLPEVLVQAAVQSLTVPSLPPVTHDPPGAAASALTGPSSLARTFPRTISTPQSVSRTTALTLTPFPGHSGKPGHDHTASAVSAVWVCSG
jgi:hypothetical protein